MAVRKMTLSLPAELAQRFERQVPSRQRSRYLAKVLEKSVQKQDEALVRSCLLANEDADGKVIEEEFAALTDRIAEPWDDSSSR